MHGFPFLSRSHIAQGACIINLIGITFFPALDYNQAGEAVGAGLVKKTVVSSEMGSICANLMHQLSEEQE